MTTDIRALCAELLILAEESISYRAQVSEAVKMIDRARAALAEPVLPAECVEVEHYDLCNMTADQMRRAADLLERLAPQYQPPAEDDLDLYLEQ